MSSLISSTTVDAFSKPNHSPLWRYGGVLYGVFQRSGDNKTTIWVLDQGIGTWSDTGVVVHDRQGDRCDVIPDPAMARVLVFASHSTQARVTALDWTGAAWAVVSGVNKISVPGIAHQENSAAGFSAGVLYAAEFRTTPELRVNWSWDSGATWQASPVVIADGTRVGDDTGHHLSTGDEGGLPDMVGWVDSAGGGHIGILLGEDPRQLWFLRLDEGSVPSDPGSWHSETMPIWAADDHVSIADMTDGRLVGFVKSHVGDTTYAALVRGVDGVWSLTQTSMVGRRPGVQVDLASGLVGCIASNTSTGTRVTCRVFDPGALVFGDELDIITNGGDNFRNGGTFHLADDSGSVYFIAGDYTNNKAWWGSLELQAPPRGETITIDVTDGVVDLAEMPESLTGLRIVSLELASDTGCTVGPATTDGFPVAAGSDGVQARAGGSVVVDYGAAGDVVGASSRLLEVVGVGRLAATFVE